MVFNWGFWGPVVVLFGVGYVPFDVDLAGYVGDVVEVEDTES